VLREVAHFLYHAPATAKLALTADGVTVYRRIMDRLDENGVGPLRARIAGGLSGRVLEIGSGTGHMFRHYPADAEVFALEPIYSFRQASREVARAARARIHVMHALAEALPFEAGSFDAIVCCFVLCSVEDVQGTLGELRRVLRPAGQLWAAEHVRSEGAVAGLLMDAFNPLWLKLNGQGCRLNRKTEEAIRSAGFGVQQVERYQIFSPGLPAFPGKLIVAARG
jgi:SAM-dependent methyltransferase